MSGVSGSGPKIGTNEAAHLARVIVVGAFVSAIAFTITLVFDMLIFGFNLTRSGFYVPLSIGNSVALFVMLTFGWAHAFWYAGNSLSLLSKLIGLGSFFALWGYINWIVVAPHLA